MYPHLFTYCEQRKMWTENPLPFLTPANICLVGSQQSGKTFLTMKLLENIKYSFSPAPKKVLYCYTEWQDKFDAMQDSIPNITFHQGLPSCSYIEEWSTERDGSLIILDDLMTSICSSLDMVQLFTVKCHHRNITTLMLNQSLFPTGKYARTLSLNCNYIILFKNYRDSNQVKCLGSQLFPSKGQYFMDAYEKATHKLYGYLCIDIHPRSDKKYQLRTNILKGEYPVVFMPRA